MDDPLIDVRINSLTEMMTTTTGKVLLEIRDEPGKLLEPINVLLVVQHKTRNKTGSISRRQLVRLIIQHFEDPMAKSLTVLSPTDIDFLELTTNLALMQSDLLSLTIQPMSFPTSACSTDEVSRFWFQLIKELKLQLLLFSIGDAQNYSRLKIEIIVDAETSCSVTNYRIFWEI